MGRPPSQTQDKFIIRLPDGMKQRIKDAADANGRTMTAEIVWRLEQSLSGVEARLDKQVSDLTDTTRLSYQSHLQIDELERRIEMLEKFAARAAAYLKIEGPSADAVLAKPKRKGG